MSGFTVFGMKAVENEMNRLARFVPDQVDKALYAEAQAIFRKSQRIVPVKGGYLKNSGVVEGPTNNEVLIGYGGPAVDYALVVHEDLEAQHKAGKQAKYLETPFLEAMSGFGERLLARIEKNDPSKAASFPAVETGAADAGGSSE